MALPDPTVMHTAGGRDLMPHQAQVVAAAQKGHRTFLLADEPGLGKTAEALLDLMAELNTNHHITFLFSSHDARVIERARRVVYLEDGRIASDREPMRRGA